MSSENEQDLVAQQGDEQGLTRWRLLQAVGTAAAVATLETMLRNRHALAAPAVHPVALGAQPFDLTAVRLLDGPFKQAQERCGPSLFGSSSPSCCSRLPGARVIPYDHMRNSLDKPGSGGL